MQDYFCITLGMLYSAEVRTSVASDNLIKHSCIELLAKDMRRMSIIMSDYEACMNLRDCIRHFAFLDQMVPER